MKKYILGLFLMSFLVVPMFTFAQVGDIDPNPDANQCVSLQSTNLRYRAKDINTNGEVSMLQDFLQSQGYFKNDPTGNFGILTVQAVKDFQGANNINRSGYAGSITRALIKSLSCGDVTTISNCASNMPSVTVLSPNGGETYQAGQQMTIKWKNCNTPIGGMTRIMLARNLPNNYQESFQILETTDNYDLNKGSYTWQIPSNIASASNYFITIVCGIGDSNCRTGSGNIVYAITDTSDNLFTINSATTITPSLTVLSPNGGETYTAGQQITVRWNSNNLPTSTPVYLLIQHHSPAGGGIGGANYATNLKEGTVLNDGVEIVTLPTQYSGRPFGKYFKIAVSTQPWSGAINPVYDISNDLFTINDIGTVITSDTTPRIMYWYGKVNQHVDANGNWLTDPDGTSGANLDKLTYCKKWFPNTTSVEDYKQETMTGWRNAGNSGGPFTSIKMSTKCVQDVVGRYDTFATCIKNSGALFYGTFWCPHCQNQKNLFGSSASILPYVECSTPDGQGQIQICKDKNIQGYPTWTFLDGTSLSGEQTLSSLASKTSCTLPN